MYKPEIECPISTMGPVTPAALSSPCSSSLSRMASRGSGRASLQPNPARSYEQTCVILDSSGCTLAQINESLPSPASSTTVGEPSPVQYKCILYPLTS